MITATFKVARVNEISVSYVLFARTVNVISNNYPLVSPGDLFPASFWNSYWEYLESYGEARRILDELRAFEDPLLHFLGLRQAAARHSPSSLLLLPVSRING